MEISFWWCWWKYYSGGGNYALDNSNSNTKSYGLEFSGNWEPNNDYILSLGYTGTKSRDGTTCDNPGATGGPGANRCNDEMNVRVPRHQIHLIGTNFNNNLKHTTN